MTARPPIESCPLPNGGSVFRFCCPYCNEQIEGILRVGEPLDEMAANLQGWTAAIKVHAFTCQAPDDFDSDWFRSSAIDCGCRVMAWERSARRAGRETKAVVNMSRVPSGPGCEAFLAKLWAQHLDEQGLN
jgi:hypothetical protein